MTDQLTAPTTGSTAHLDTIGRDEFDAEYLRLMASEKKLRATSSKTLNALGEITGDAWMRSSLRPDNTPGASADGGAASELSKLGEALLQMLSDLRYQACGQHQIGTDLMRTISDGEGEACPRWKYEKALQQEKCSELIIALANTLESQSKLHHLMNPHQMLDQNSVQKKLEANMQSAEFPDFDWYVENAHAASEKFRQATVALEAAQIDAQRLGRGVSTTGLMGSSTKEQNAESAEKIKRLEREVDQMITDGSVESQAIMRFCQRISEQYSDQCERLISDMSHLEHKARDDMFVFETAESSLRPLIECFDESLFKRRLEDPSASDWSMDSL